MKFALVADFFTEYYLSEECEIVSLGSNWQADINHVIGTFNAALEKNYVICMDESLFKGDKASMERLKSAITEPTIRVEQKYQPSRTINSYHRFFAASNSEHFANIPIDDRRFVFIRVSDRKQQDLNYFNIIHKAINDSSVIGAMVYDLLKSI